MGDDAHADNDDGAAQAFAAAAGFYLVATVLAMAAVVMLAGVPWGLLVGAVASLGAAVWMAHQSVLKASTS